MQGLGFGLTVRSITWMSPGLKAPRTQVWLESLGEWTWPGQRLATAEVLPPAWVPTLPPARSAPAAAPDLPAPWARARRVLIAVLLSALLAVSAALALREPIGLASGARTHSAGANVGPGARPAPPAGAAADRHRRRGQSHREGLLPLRRAAPRRLLLRLPAPRIPRRRSAARTAEHPLSRPLPAARQQPAGERLPGNRAAGRTGPADRRARDPAADRRDDPGWPRRQQLAQPG